MADKILIQKKRISQKDALIAVRLLSAYIYGVDTCVEAANSDSEKVADVFRGRTAKETYESMQTSDFYKESKALTHRLSR